MVDRHSWLNERRKLIGASDAASILGEGYKSPLEVWCDKSGLPTADDEPSDALEIGNIIQPAIAEIARRKTGLVIVEEPPHVIRRHPRLDFMGCSLDGVAAKNTPDTWGDDLIVDTGIAELKNVGAYNARDWQPAPPLKFQIQAQHQMAVTGLGWGLVFGLVGGNKPVWHIVLRNDPFIAALEKACEEFWRRVVEKDPPPPDGSESARRALAALYPLDNGDAIALPEEAEIWAAELDSLKEEISERKEQEKIIEQKIRAAIKDASAGTLPDGSGYTLRTQTRPAHEVQAASFRVLRRTKSVKKSLSR
jgi:putative phage-type endonuclease